MKLVRTPLHVAPARYHPEGWKLQGHLKTLQGYLPARGGPARLSEPTPRRQEDEPAFWVWGLEFRI